MEGLRKSERQMHLMSRMQGDPEKYMEWLSIGLKRLETINRVRTRVLSDIETHLSGIITHHEQEKQLSEALNRKEQVEQNRMRLARLYYDSGDMVLAEKALQQIGTPTRDTALFYFYLGCVKAYLGEPDQAEKHFETCCRHDESLQKEVNDFRTKFGDDYNRYIQRLKSDGYDIKRMILKGLRHCWNHETINREITTLAVQDLTIIESSIDKGTIQEETSRIRNWISDMEQHPNLEKALGCDLVSKFHQYHGHLRVAEGKNQDATACFQMALSLTPKRPELHIFLADSFFAENHFDTAIEHLIQAVELDRSYAVFWENIGDNLHNTGQFENAIIAYEQCFIILPEKIELLKKIGDCYQRLDQGEAALASYQQLQVRMKQHTEEMQQQGA
jgi:tetratricopeptide (TPR) repeat protein